MKNKENKEKIEQPTLADDQLELLSSHNKNNGPTTTEPFDKSSKARVLRYAKKHKVFSIAIIIILVSLLITLSLLIAFSISLYINRDNKSDFSITIGNKTYSEAYKDIMINDMMYIDMSKFSEIDEIQISGDSVSRKFTLPNLQYVRFQNNSNIAIVDGTYFDMKAKAIINGDVCLVPMDFISKIFDSGIVIEIDSDKNTIKISRVEAKGSKKNEPIYEPIGITTEIDAAISNVAYMDFGFDVKLYDNILEPKNDDFLLLINHSNPLSKDYVPSDLVELTCKTNPVNTPSYYRLRKIPAQALSIMMDSMERCGIDGILVSSTYRSYERQEYIFDSYIKNKMAMYSMSYEEAKTEVLKTSALPGHSEHQTGLCVDFVQGTTSLTNDFQNTTAFKWLAENAHKFGFILRYPINKEDITGYNYEPWHYRFVGRTVASRIYEANICFEEYLALY